MAELTAGRPAYRVNPPYPEDQPWTLSVGLVHRLADDQLGVTYRRPPCEGWHGPAFELVCGEALERWFPSFEAAAELYLQAARERYQKIREALAALSHPDTPRSAEAV